MSRGWVSLEHPAASITWGIPQARELSRGPGWARASLQLGLALCYLGGIDCTFVDDIDGFEQTEGPWAASPACVGGSGLRAAPLGAGRAALSQTKEPRRGPVGPQAPTPLGTLGGSGLRAAPPEGARAPTRQTLPSAGVPPSEKSTTTRARRSASVS